MVGEVRRPEFDTGHAPCGARGADAPALAEEGRQEVMPAVATAGARKTVGEDAAFQVFGKRFANIGLGAGVVALAVELARAGQGQARSRSARPLFGRAVCVRGGAGCSTWVC